MTEKKFFDRLAASLPPLYPAPFLQWMTNRQIFTEALRRGLIVPWGVECEVCGAAFYGEDSRIPCLACRSKTLVPLYAGRHSDVVANAE